ncbi:MAG: extracellular solute-binding protein [Chloroflexi bacterium]|nr:extracellular solute-binding protein [Chloroflexota bacterium]
MPSTAVPPTAVPPTAVPPTATLPPVVLHFMYYQDAAEASIMAPLVTKFQLANPGILVELDVVPYANITNQLPAQVQAGQAPDMARITNFGAFRGYLLDLTPYLSDPSFMTNNFAAPVLAAMRASGDTTGLYGFPDTLTVTGPYVNTTLFEQANVDLPGGNATWQDWTDAAAQVATATSVKYAIGSDATGHRLASVIISDGGTLLTPDGNFTIDTQGFRDAVTMLKNWQDQGLTDNQIWIKSGNSCINDFMSGDMVFCLSGSWQVGNVAKTVASNFDWQVVPAPTGAGGSVGIAGGSAVVAFSSTQYPTEVAKFMEFLMQPENYSYFSANTLALPAETAVATAGVDYNTTDPNVKAALNAFTAGVQNITDQGWALNPNPNAFAYYQNAVTRISQYLTGELTLDEMITKHQADIDTAIAQKQ